ncbi:hypothetical protein LTR17_013695 [Elasticomyces elasticus]|nr:hypothetical protein LTR17_013695 [Elasticomyces elasticus]
MAESMIPLLEQPYEKGTECISCGKLGYIQQLTPATDSASPGKLGLLGLPQEIRDEIYRLVVISEDTPQSYVLDARDDDRKYLLSKQRFRGALQPALSCVCRDLRDEVLAIFYNEHTLLFDVSDEPGIAPLAPRVQNWWLTSPSFLAASRYKASDIALHISVSAPLYARPGDPDPTGVETDDAVLLLEYRAGKFTLEVGGDVPVLISSSFISVLFRELAAGIEHTREHHTAMAQATGRCHLLRLPTELREIIHRFVNLGPGSRDLRYSLRNTRQLPGISRASRKPEQCPCDTDRSISGKNAKRHQHMHCPQQPALARTCRELRMEILPIFYGESRVVFDIEAAYEDSGLIRKKEWWLLSDPFLVAARYMQNATIITRAWPMGAWAYAITITSRPLTRKLEVVLENEGDYGWETYERRCLDARTPSTTLSPQQSTSANCQEFVNWSTVTMVPFLVQPYGIEHYCWLCAKPGCTLLIAAS